MNMMFTPCPAPSMLMSAKHSLEPRPLWPCKEGSRKTLPGSVLSARMVPSVSMKERTPL